MKKAWFRWNWNGARNEDPLGIKVIEGDGQPTKNAGIHFRQSFYFYLIVLVIILW